ncbi:hypothetical protein LNTAR_19272 [Lentisphaera araneosa HTCC2155]|uniref:Uncharacterized protein n=1 Tax=Lentisphaera araneosa HTCC2155 TaxID=313628 RepID=A6DQS0_9BACT|nr:hypothetical protein [Lentisphaera araneosa]EDM25970.1 hypothetical protein LNTAR_19272 [Lentisphaera araneosa HTCC2155]
MKEKIKKTLKQFSFLIVGMLIGVIATYFISKQALWMIYGDSSRRHLHYLVSTIETVKDQEPSAVRDKCISNLYFYTDRINTLKNDKAFNFIISEKNLDSLLTSCKKRLNNKNIDLESLKLKNEKLESHIRGIIETLEKY